MIGQRDSRKKRCQVTKPPNFELNLSALTALSSIAARLLVAGPCQLPIMICQRCLRASQPPSSRFISRNPTLRKSSRLSALWGPSPITQERSPTATFKPTSQSFSTSVGAPSPQTASSSSSEPATVSSVPAGTLLRGLGYLKGKDPPIAKEDHEYPKWLWGLLDEGKKKAQMEGGVNQGDSYCKYHYFEHRQDAPVTAGAYED